MTIALFHLALASLALLAAAGGTALLLALWRERVQASYRLVVLVLAGTLALAAAQVVLERSRLEFEAPFVARFARLATVEPTAAPDAELAPSSPSNPVALPELEEDFRAGVPELHASAASEPLSPTVREPARSLELRRTLMAWLVPAWAAGACAFLLRSLRRLLAARALVAKSKSAEDGEIQRAWREARRAWPLARGVQLRVSDDIRSPACFGLFARVILLPAHAHRTLEPACLSQVLLHELIHLERRDAWAMCLAELVRAVFWFHPAAWFLCRKADELRELSCDALVVRRTGRPRTYARGLVACAERMRGVRALPHTGALPSWTGSKSQFSRRIEMLLHSSSEQRSVSWFTKGLIGATFALFGGGQLALAASAPQESRSRHATPPLPPSAPETPEPFDFEWPESFDFEGWGQATPPAAPSPFAPGAPGANGTPAVPPLPAMPQPFAQMHVPAFPPSASFAPGERIRRATELLERALERNPGDEDLRQAIELLNQVRVLGAAGRFAPTPRPDGSPRAEAWRDARRYAQEAELEARRAQLDAEKHRIEAQRAFERLGRSYDDARVRPDGSREDVETQLEETRRILEERRTELEELRHRIEELRARERSRETTPEGRRESLR